MIEIIAAAVAAIVAVVTTKLIEVAEKRIRWGENDEDGVAHKDDGSAA